MIQFASNFEKCFLAVEYAFYYVDVENIVAVTFDAVTSIRMYSDFLYNIVCRICQANSHVDNLHQRLILQIARANATFRSCPVFL